MLNILEIKNLVYKIDSYKNKPFSLIIKGGECVCLSGDSGSGKTLMLRAIADLDSHQGLCFLNKQEQASMSANQWRKLVGFVNAQSEWWFDYVGEHFLNKINVELFKAVGFNLDVLNWKIDRLSSGEKQRLALLRILNQNPKVLLLDEPTANLDSNNQRSVENMLISYCKQKSIAVLWVSHDKKQIERIANKHLYIKNRELKHEKI
jgi:ABC-type iron transport system FetAB ATPase subunit